MWHLFTAPGTHVVIHVYVVCLQSSLAKLGIPLNDVLRVLVAVMLLGNVSFYESKEQELGIQGSEGGV